MIYGGGGANNNQALTTAMNLFSQWMNGKSGSGAPGAGQSGQPPMAAPDPNTPITPLPGDQPGIPNSGPVSPPSATGPLPSLSGDTMPSTGKQGGIQGPDGANSGAATSGILKLCAG